MNRLLLIALVAAAAPTRTAAQEAVRPSAIRAAAETSPRVRASHRVDVIAPGERVDTVLDRARGASAAAARGATAVQTLPIRPPEKRPVTAPPPQDAAVRPGTTGTPPAGAGSVPGWGGAAPGWAGNTGTWGTPPAWGNPPAWGTVPPGGYPRGDVPPPARPPQRR
jgi:hypothetical protein